MKKRFTKNLIVIKAVYYDPKIGPEHGTDVTAELSSRINRGQLFYDGLYNNIFPDNFKRISKRLKVIVEFRGKEHIKFYNENEKINLPSELDSQSQMWWEQTWFQILVGLGAIAGILALIEIFRP